VPLFIQPGFTLYFAHVPKAGGSSLRIYLHERLGPPVLAGWTFLKSTHRRVMLAPAEHAAVHEIAPHLPARIDHRLALVRDPLARTFSQYRFQAGKSLLSRLGFSTWLRVMIGAARIEPRIHENHLRPQVDLIPEGSEIFRLEDGFDRLIAWVDTLCGQSRPDLAVPHALKSDRRRPIRCHRQDIALILDHYAADYDRLGYARPDPADYPKDAIAPLRALVAAPLARLLVAWQRWRRRY
jgi:hypothetical protein